MINNIEKIFLIDFDSTFIKSEGLDELAAIALKKNPQGKKLLEEIRALTRKGMEGEISFSESLARRIELIQADKQIIGEVAVKLKRNITPSILRNKEFFRKFRDNIFIISGGFKEFIIPVIKPFGIREDHVFANTFIFDGDRISGIDNSNPLSKEGGKALLLRSLELKGDIYVIGDGYTDYQLKETGLIKKFIAFTENIERSTVTENADIIAPSFDEFLYINKLPMSVSYPKNRIKAVLLENLDNRAVELLEKEGYSVEYYNRSLSEDDLTKVIKDAFILGIRSRTAVDKNVLDKAQKLLAVGAFCIGTNNIDLKYAAQKGVAVFNAPYSNSRSVVELTLGEIIMLMRNVIDKNAKMHKGIWDKTSIGTHEAKGKTLGIIGYGNIGAQLGILAEALGMKVCFYDIAEKPVLGNAEKCPSLDRLLKISDIITVHVDGRKENAGLIGENEFAKMKNGVYFLNLSRGSIVDVGSLVKHIKSGKIKGAAIDVFPKEPKSKEEPFSSELQTLPNVILTPHIGGNSEEAQRNIAEFMGNKLIEYINTGNTNLSVNLPNIRVGEQGRARRLLHLHKNIPGILAKINGILAEHNINILGQYLRTNEDIGYVITDVDKEYDEKVINILKSIPNTIRFRILY